MLLKQIFTSISREANISDLLAFHFCDLSVRSNIRSRQNCVLETLRAALRARAKMGNHEKESVDLQATYMLKYW